MPTLHPYYAAVALTAIALFVLFALVFFAAGARRGVGAGIGATAITCAAATAVVLYVVLPRYPDPPTSGSAGNVPADGETVVAVGD